MPIWSQIPGKVEYPFVLNDASPQADGLVGWWPGTGAGGKLWDMSGRSNNGTLTNFAAPFTATSGWVAGVDGGKGALAFTGNNDHVLLTSKSALITYPGTVSTWLYANTLGPGDSRPTYINSDAEYLAIQGNTGYLQRFNGGWQTASTGAIVTGKWHHIAIVNNTSTWKYYLNGKEVYSGTQSAQTVSATATYLGLRIDVPNSPFSLDGKMEDTRFYNRALSAAEVAALYDPRTRWELRYVPGRVAYYIGSGGGGSAVTVTPTTAAITLTTFAPTVSTPRLCTPTTKALTITTFAPTVRLGATVTPTTKALTLATFAPVVLTPRLVTPSTLALTTTKFAPSAVIGILATPTTKSLVLTTFAPTVSTPRLCTPTTLSLTLTTYAPTVTGGQGLTVTPTTKALTLTTFAPTVVNPKSATPTTLALTITAFAPTVSTPRTATPTTRALTISTFAPTVQTPRLCTPGVLALVTTRYAPSISTGDVEVVPSTLALTLTGYSPTITVRSANVQSIVRVPGRRTTVTAAGSRTTITAKGDRTGEV